eukprot:3778750-Amphidinium_carterae.4
MALDSLDPEELADARKDHVALALDFCSMRDDASTGPKKTKLHRTKVWQWLRSTHHMLRSTGMQGWGDFLPRQDQHPASLKSVTVTIDQGSDGWSAGNYLLDRKYCITLLGDSSHRGWNDTQHALADSRLTSIVLSCIILCNQDHGPWGSQRWYESAKQAAEEYMVLSRGTNDSLFAAFEDIITDECAEDEKELESLMKSEEVWLSIPAALDKKIGRVGTSRWFAVLLSMKQYLRMRGRRLVINMHLALSQGMYAKGRAAELLKLPSLQKPVAGADAPKTTTSNDRSEIQSMRSKYHNTLAFNTALLADSCVWKQILTIVSVTEPMQEFHSSQNRLNRSLSESGAWWRDMTDPSLSLAHVNGIMSKLHDKSVLEKLGLHMGLDEVVVAEKYDMSDPVYGIEDDLASSMADLTIALVGRRVRTMSQHLGLPQEVQPLTSAYWSKVKGRSFFHYTKVAQIIQLLQDSSWQLSDVVLNIVKSDFMGVTQTKVIEDAFRLGRVAEVNTGFCKKVAVERLYDKLITSDLAAEVHRYPHIDAENYVVGRGLQSNSCRGLFEPPPKENGASAFREVVSNKSSSPYHSPAPMLCTAPLEDVRLWQWCKDVHGDLTLAERAWLSVLVVPNAFMLKHPKFNNGEYCLGLRSYTGVVAYGLPLECIMVNGKEFWAPAPLK